MATSTSPYDAEILDMIGDELSEEEERALIEQETRRTLGISVEEFRRRWENGEYRRDENPQVTRIAMLLR